VARDRNRKQKEKTGIPFTWISENRLVGSRIQESSEEKKRPKESSTRESESLSSLKSDSKRRGIVESDQ
jgi:hypothetical protein